MKTDTVAVRLAGEHLEMARELTISLILEEAECLADSGTHAPDAALVLRDLGYLLLNLGRGRLAWVHNGELDATALETLRHSCEDIIERSECLVAANEVDEDTLRRDRMAHAILWSLRTTGLPS